MKNIIYAALLLGLSACEKESTVSPSYGSTEQAPYDQMISGNTCAQGSFADVYLMQSHNDLPRLAPSGAKVIVHLYGTRYMQGGSEQWTTACFNLYVNGVLKATFTATSPQEFTYAVP